MLLLKNENWPPLAPLESEIFDLPSNMQRYLVEFLFDSNAQRDIKGIDNLDDYIENPKQFVTRFKRNPQYTAFFAPDNQGDVKVEKLKKSARDALTALGELSVFDALESAGLSDEDRKNLGFNLSYAEAKKKLMDELEEGSKEVPSKEEILAMLKRDNQELNDLKIRQILDQTTYRDLFIGYHLSPERMEVPDESQRETITDKKGKKIPIKFKEELHNLRKDVLDGKFVMDDKDIKDSLEIRELTKRRGGGIQFILNMSDEAGSPTKMMKDKLVELGFKLSDWEIERVPPTKETKKVPDSLYGAGKIKELMNAITSEEKQYNLLAGDNKVIEALKGQIEKIKEEVTIDVGSKNRVLFLDTKKLRLKLEKVEASKAGNPFKWVDEINRDIDDMGDTLLEYYTDRVDYLEEDKNGALYLFRTQFNNEQLKESDYTKFYEAKSEWAREIASRKITTLNENIFSSELNSGDTYTDKDVGMFIEEEEMLNMISSKKKDSKLFARVIGLVEMLGQMELEVINITNQSNLHKETKENSKGKEVESIREIDGVPIRTYNEGLPVITNKGKVKDSGKIIQLSAKIQSAKKEYASFAKLQNDMDKLAERYSTSKQLKDLFAMMGATMGEYSKELGIKGKMLTIKDAENAIKEIESRQERGVNKTKMFEKILIDGQGGKDGVLMRLMRKSPFVNLAVFGKSKFVVDFQPKENDPSKMLVDIQVWHHPKGKLRLRYAGQTTYDFIPSGSAPRIQLERGDREKVGINPYRRRWLVYVKERETLIKNAIGL